MIRVADSGGNDPDPTPGKKPGFWNLDPIFEKKLDTDQYNKKKIVFCFMLNNDSYPKY